MISKLIKWETKIVLILDLLSLKINYFLKIIIVHVHRGLDHLHEVRPGSPDIIGYPRPSFILKIIFVFTDIRFQSIFGLFCLTIVCWKGAQPNTYCCGKDSKFIILDDTSIQYRHGNPNPDSFSTLGVRISLKIGKIIVQVFF